MGLFLWALALVGVTPDEGVALAEKSANALERTGLYGVIIVLLAGLVVIFILKERQLAKRDAETKEQLEAKEKHNKELQSLVIQMVQQSTTALTEANMNNRKIEIHLERLTREK